MLSGPYPLLKLATRAHLALVKRATTATEQRLRSLNTCRASMQLEAWVRRSQFNTFSAQEPAGETNSSV